MKESVFFLNVTEFSVWDKGPMLLKRESTEIVEIVIFQSLATIVDCKSTIVDC